ncbi:MAG: DUF4838 domain-containing protein [Lentisphaeria bacterium]|nr:DUF4838 domain-containing protein [Lentisphaeria bacterium]
MRKLCIALVLTAAAALFAAEVRFEPRAVSPRFVKLDQKVKLVLKPGNFEVVIPARPAPVVKYSAKVLAETLGKMFDCKVPVVTAPTAGKISLCPGDTKLAKQLGLDLAKLDRDGYYIRTAGNKVLMIGRDNPTANPPVHVGNHERATFFATLEFLERFCGVRFYFPGEMGTVIPRRNEIVLPGIDLADRPDMQYRTFYFKTWGPIMDGQKFAYTGAPKNLSGAANLILRTSTLHVPNCHGLRYLGLVERFGKTHPEYFALNANGSRWNGATKVGNSNYDGGHICLSCEEVKNEVLKDAEACLTGQPASVRGVLNGSGKVGWAGVHTRPFFNLMPNDGMPPCYCDKCRPIFQSKDPLRISTFIWKYFSSFARTLQEHKVPGYVTCMAYANYKEIPECDIPSNIIVQLAVTGPYDEKRSWQTKNDQLLIDWGKKLGTKPYLWLYPSKCRAPIGWIPNCAPRAMGAYLKRQAPYCFGAFHESETDIWLFGYLNHYVAGKVMWDSSTDVKKLLDEHYKLMFGAAGPVVQKIFDRLEDIWLDKICGNCVDTPVGPKAVLPSQAQVWNEIYSESMMKAMDKEFDRAEKLVAKDPESLKRLKFIRQEFWKPFLAGRERYRQSCEILDESESRELKPGEKITLDGKLDDPAWKNAPSVWLRRRKIGINTVSTKVSMLYDKDHFYFGFWCEEPETDKIIAAARKHDDNNLWEDNCVEVFLDTRGDRKEFYQIMLSSKNCVTDRWSRPGIMGWEWNAKARTAVAIQPGKSWTAEFKIPRSSMSPAKGKFNADFTRLRTLQGKTEYYNWIELPPRNAVERYGVVHMSPRVNTNLLKDPDFQSKQGGHKGRFIGPWAAHKTIHRDTSIFRFGGSSCRMGDGCYSVEQRFTGLKPKKKYRFSYFLKLDKVDLPGLYVRIFEGNGRVHTLPRVFPKGTAPWHKLSFPFMTGENPPKDGKSTVLFMFKKGNDCINGTVWIDRVEIREEK